MQRELGKVVISRGGFAIGWQHSCTTPSIYRFCWLWNKDLITLPCCTDSCDHCQEVGIQTAGKTKKKTYPFSGLERKPLFRITLLINLEHPGGVNGLFISTQNVGCISQEERAEKCGWQHRLILTNPTLRGCFHRVPFKKAPAVTNWANCLIMTLRYCGWFNKKKEKTVCLCATELCSRAESPDHWLQVPS